MLSNAKGARPLQVIVFALLTIAMPSAGLPQQVGHRASLAMFAGLGTNSGSIVGVWGPRATVVLTSGLAAFAEYSRWTTFTGCLLVGADPCSNRDVAVLMGLDLALRGPGTLIPYVGIAGGVVEGSSTSGRRPTVAFQPGLRVALTSALSAHFGAVWLVFDDGEPFTIGMDRRFVTRLGLEVLVR